ncbi:MAG: sulfite exporter TauE/SafE family protein [Quisquiliibacterium sp.]
MIHDPQTWMIVILAAFGGAIVGGVGGFGTGVILTAVLAPLIGVKAVVPVLAVAGVLINIGRFWFYRRHVQWPAVGRLLLAAFPCLLLGTQLYARLDPAPLGVLIGVAVIASVPVRRYLRARQIVVGPRGLIAGGGLFGFVSGFASGMGVLLVSFLYGAGFAGMAVLATDALVTIIVDLARAALFGRYALLDAQAIWLGIAIGLVTLPGSAVAAWLVRRMHAQLHARFMEALIIFGGVMILATSVG